MIQLQVMNNERSDMCHRQFAQTAFDESLASLQELSPQPEEPLDAEMNASDERASECCRQLAQEAFEESLNALQQLSLEPGEAFDAETNLSEEMISWDEVADDLDRFFEGLMFAEEIDELPPPEV